MFRPDWKKYFGEIAGAVSARAECRRSLVGCVMVRDNRIIATGYNGAAPGALSCLDGACPRGLLTYEEVSALSDYKSGPGLCIGIHAEDNAIRDARRRGIDLTGCTAYITRSPCSDCQILLPEAGIVLAVWPEGEQKFLVDL